MSGDDRTQVHFTVDRNAKELAKEKLEFGELSNLLRDEVHRVAFGEEISKREQLQERLNQLREERDELRSEKRQIETDIEEKETEIARVEERLSGLERKEDRYEATLEMLEETLLEGGRVFEDHGQVIKASKVGGKEPEDVIAELKERNPNVPDHAFVEMFKDRTEWAGEQELSNQ